VRPDRPLGIIELLTRIGEENVCLQNLLESATSVEARKRGQTAITFLTNQMNPSDLVQATPTKIGLVLWLPADLVEKARQEHAEAITSVDG
jgi:hypothetical protein